MPECILSEAGFDYITLTTTAPQTISLMSEVFRQDVVEDVKHGFDPVCAGWHGFRGQRTKHMFFGSLGDRYLLQVSGGRAKGLARLARSGDHCTRLDIQISLRLSAESVSEYLDRQFANLLRLHPDGSKYLVPVRFQRGSKTETVYSGSRTSDLYVRLYDKFAESADERYRNVVRLELEIKGKTSQALWTKIAEEGVGTMFVLEQLLGVLAARGVDVSGIDIEHQDIIRPKAQPFKVNTSLAWLKQQVAPTVARIAGEVGWYAAFSMLFSDAIDSNRYRRVSSLLAVNWGS